MKAKDIINQLLEYKCMKAGSFAKEIGVHPTQIYDLQSEKTKKISALIASKIVNRYPEYDPIWLLTGEGDMFKPQQKPTVAAAGAAIGAAIGVLAEPGIPAISTLNGLSSSTEPENEDINKDSQDEQIESQRTIEVLIKVIETYQDRVDDLLNVVESLKNESTKLKSQLESKKAS